MSGEGPLRLADRPALRDRGAPARAQPGQGEAAHRPVRAARSPTTASSTFLRGRRRRPNPASLPRRDGCRAEHRRSMVPRRIRRDPNPLPGPTADRPLRAAGAKRKGAMLIAGVDEAGRGPLAGPVVAAAVIFETRRYPEGIDDSKRLTALARARAPVRPDHRQGRSCRSRWRAGRGSTA